MRFTKVITLLFYMLLFLNNCSKSINAEGLEREFLPILTGETAKIRSLSATRTHGVSEGTDSYVIENIFDNNPQTAWFEGGWGPGLRESIVIQLDRFIRFDAIQIVNGFQKDDNTFQQSSRLKRISIKVPLVSTNHFVSFMDSTGFQRMPLSVPLDAEEIIMTIDAVYPGTVKGTEYNTALSELSFYFQDKEIPVNKESHWLNRTLKNKSRLIPTFDATDYFYSILDTAIYSFINVYSSIGWQEWLFQSNGKFYYKVVNKDMNGEMFAGKWEIFERKPEKIVVKVIGKYREDHKKGMGSNTPLIELLNQIRPDNKIKGTSDEYFFFELAPHKGWKSNEEKMKFINVVLPRDIMSGRILYPMGGGELISSQYFHVTNRPIPGMVMVERPEEVEGIDPELFLKPNRKKLGN